MEENQYIYVVLQHSGSATAKFLRAMTKDEFTHVSLSFDPTLNEMYSFARRSMIVPFYAGFTQESKDRGLLKKYKDSKIQVLKLQIDTEKLANLKRTIEEMYAHKKEYKYSFKGVIMAYFNKEYPRDHYFYCSEFVKKMLVENDVVKEGVLPPVTKPIDFQKIEELDGVEVVYTGRLDQYVPEM